MKPSLLFVLAILVAGCGTSGGGATGGAKFTINEGNPPSGAKASEAGQISESDLGIPFYPGSTPVASGSVSLSTDIGDTKSVIRMSTDSPTQVADFYTKEGAKVGKVKDIPATSDMLKSVGVDLPDGTSWAIQATLGNDKRTQIHVSHFYPKKK